MNTVRKAKTHYYTQNKHVINLYIVFHTHTLIYTFTSYLVIRGNCIVIKQLNPIQTFQVCIMYYLM